MRLKRSDARDGIVAGAVAGVVAGVPSTVHAAITRRSLLGSTRAIAGLVGLDGAGPLVQLAVGATLHGALSIGWGVAAALTLPRRHTALVGAVAGLGVGAVDLAVGRRRVLAIRALPLGPQLADHAVFGAVAGSVVACRRLRRDRAAEVA